MGQASLGAGRVRIEQVAEDRGRKSTLEPLGIGLAELLLDGTFNAEVEVEIACESFASEMTTSLKRVLNVFLTGLMLNSESRLPAWLLLVDSSASGEVE